MRIAAMFGVAMIIASPLHAETINAPSFRANDSWVVQQTKQDKTGWHQERTEFVINHLSGSALAVDIRPAGSQMPPRGMLFGTDWSRTRDVNGHQTLVNRPLAFPLSVGKNWETDYTENNPNPQHSSERFHTTCKVIGWDDVTVAAGNFNGLKIECEGEWHAVVAPSVSAASGGLVNAQGSTVVAQTQRVTAHEASGRIYRAFWYAPSVKRWVKSVEEYYGSNGQRTEQFTEELVSVKLAE